MLHLLYIIEFYIFILLVTALIFNKNLAPLLFLGESLLIFFFILSIFLASLLNVYYLIGFSFFILILGGLELTLNILLLIV